MTAIHISTFERKVMLITYITTASFFELEIIKQIKNFRKLISCGISQKLRKNAKASCKEFLYNCP